MKRKRWGIALILFTLLCSLFFLSACAKSETDYADSGAKAARSNDMAQSYATDEAGQTDQAAGELSAQPADIDLHTPADAKIIRSGYVDMETTSFDQTLSDLSAQAGTLGGYVESYNVSGSSYTDDAGRFSTLTVRIPADQFSAFTDSLSAYGNITHSEMFTEDVTSQYTDIEARLTSLRTQETRLLELLAQAEDVSDILEIEAQLSDVRYEIESLTGMQKNYDERIAYSTLTINIREVSTLSIVSGVPQSFGEELAQSFTNSIKAFAKAARGFAVGVVYALPYLIIVALIVFLIVFFTRRASRKRRARMAAQPGMPAYGAHPAPPVFGRQSPGPERTAAGKPDESTAHLPANYDQSPPVKGKKPIKPEPAGKHTDAAAPKKASQNPDDGNSQPPRQDK